MPYLTWLHFSDLHYCERSNWDAFSALTPLTADLKRLEQEYGLQPDLLFFTGDAAFGHLGDAPDKSISGQFIGASELLQEIRDCFSTPVLASNTFIVPGNHDVRREAVANAQIAYLDNSANLDAVQQHIQDRDVDWQGFVARLADYRGFLDTGGYTHLLSDPERLIYAITREFHGHKIGIAGFNTAWSCCRNSEKGKLWVAGRWQCNVLRKQLQSVDLSIALTHHPSNWLREEEDPEFSRTLERQFDVHLHGHEHQQWISENARMGHVRLAAGACYDNSERPNGYSVGRVNLESWELEIWLRQFDPTGGGWLPRVIHGQTSNEGRLALKLRPGRSILDVPPSFPAVGNAAGGSEDDLPQLLDRVLNLAATRGLTVSIAPPSMAPTSDTAPGQSATPDNSVEPRLQLIRGLIESGRHLAAAEALRALRAEAWHAAPGDARAKLANLQGCAALGAGDLTGATRHFDEAIAYDPRSVKVVANVAQVRLLSGRSNEALRLSERARELDPLFEPAAAVYLQALLNVEGVGAVRALVDREENRWMLVSPHCKAALACAEMEDGNWARAEEMLEGVIRGGDAQSVDPQYYLMLATAVMTPLRERLDLEQRRPGELTGDERGVLARADELHSAAIERYQAFDTAVHRLDALAYRAGARVMAGRFQEALRDCERVLEDDPRHLAALENKGRALLDMGRAADAAAEVEKLLPLLKGGTGDARPRRSPQERAIEVRHLLAGCYLQSVQYDRVLSALGAGASPDWTLDGAPVATAELLLYAASELSTPDAARIAEQARDYLESVGTEDVRAFGILSQHAMRRGDEQAAVQALRSALEHAPAEARSRYLLDLAQLHYQQRKFAEAVPLFQEVIGGRGDHPSAPAFTVALYNSGLYVEALEMARQVHGASGVTRGVADIEAAILERGGDLSGAREVHRRLAAAFPQEVAHRIREAYLSLRMDEREHAIRLVEAIPFDAVSQDAEALMNLARLRLHLGLPEVLRYAYRARQVEFSDADVHAQYMSLCLALDAHAPETRDSLEERTQAVAGDAVTLVRDSSTTTFILEDEEPIHPERGELGPGDERATRLLGVAVGDTVSIRDGVLGAEGWLVTEIKSKYVYAAHETSRLFREEVLRHPGLQVLDTSSPGFFERFWEFLDRRSYEAPDLHELYRTEPLPFASFARGVQRPIIDLWLALTEWPEARLFAFAGTAEDAAEQQQRLAGETAPALSLDLTALLTIAYLELEAPVKSRFARILISRTVMDTLQEHEAEIRRHCQPRGSVGSERGRPFFVETPPERIERRQALVERMFAFVRDAAEVVPTMALLQAEERDRQALGAAELSAALTAQEQGALFYCDDLRLRQLAALSWQISGVDSQGILADLSRRGLLDGDGHARALGKLADARYFFVSLTADHLMALLELNSFRAVPEVQVAFRTFEGPDSLEEAAVNVLADVIKRVWLRNLLAHQKTAVLDLALFALVKGRRRDRVILRLLQALAARLRLVEHLLAGLRASINLWLRVNRDLGDS